jgi:hypothetical protein
MAQPKDGSWAAMSARNASGRVDCSFARTATGCPGESPRCRSAETAFSRVIGRIPVDEEQPRRSLLQRRWAPHAYETVRVNQRHSRMNDAATNRAPCSLAQSRENSSSSFSPTITSTRCRSSRRSAIRTTGRGRSGSAARRAQPASAAAVEDRDWVSSTVPRS